ncbi:MAG: hypothetical protein IPH56_05270 [Chitinophagaceae bacterium]|nr:hypothetical protein [Chitinophagaceae bacterium]
MSKVLGLDLGTNSIGWAIIDTDNNQIESCGTRIFPGKAVRHKRIARQKEGTYLQLSTCFTSFHLQQFYYHCMIEPVGNFGLIYL